MDYDGLNIYLHNIAQELQTGLENSKYLKENGITPQQFVRYVSGLPDPEVISMDEPEFTFVTVDEEGNIKDIAKMIMKE